MNGDISQITWTGMLHRRARLIHQQMATLQRLVSESNGMDEDLNTACAPYYRLLDQLYQQDMPVARALDTSDLLLHLEGEGLQTSNPRLSLVTAIMGDVRKQIGSVVKTLIGTLHERLELPKEIEFGLSSYALGSLYLGFSLPEPAPGHTALTGDPIFAAAREALVTLGSTASHLSEPDAYERIKQELADPKLRDAALSAVGQLAPSGRRGVSSVAIGGRALKEQAWRILTPQTRLQIRAWLEQPVTGHEVLEFRGLVRAIDLDLRRFDLRHLHQENLPDLRCIYPASFDVFAKQWLDKTLIVKGRVETYQGKPRLLQVTEIAES